MSFEELEELEGIVLRNVRRSKNPRSGFKTDRNEDVRFVSSLGEKFFWGDDNCDLALRVKEFVEGNDGNPEEPSQSPRLRSMEAYFKKCLYDRDTEGMDKLARIFRRAVEDRAEYNLMNQIGYAYGEARILSGMNPPLRRHVQEAYKRRRPDLSEDALKQNLEDFAEKANVELVVSKTGAPKKGTRLYEIANQRLKEINPHSTDPISVMTSRLLTDLLTLFGKKGE